jgi:L-threonylcarbamoyladenylate synthase
MKPGRAQPTRTARQLAAAVQRACRRLRAGGVVALPTETVYGLAANAFDAAAVARIFEIKGRPAHNPVIVHVASLEMAHRCVKSWPPLARKLAHAFWPGPLTLVLPRAKEVPDVVTAGGPTVGVRWPSHPIMQAVIRECGFPLAAPSANLSNQISPTTTQHVIRQLGKRIELVLDGGASQIGLESTVLDLTVSPPRILRPGMIHEQALGAVIGQPVHSAGAEKGALKSPGLLRRHYAPRARLLVFPWRDEDEFRERIGRWKVRRSRAYVIAHTHVPSDRGLGGVSVLPHEPAAFARSLYGELHECDERGAELIVVEAVPVAGEWRAIADRLGRAAAA